MGVRLGAAADANPPRAGRLAADHAGGAAVGDRAAVEQFERHRHRLRGHHVGNRDRLVELSAGMHQRVLAHQHRELGKVLLREAVFMHVARRDQAVIGRDRRPQRHLVVGMADLGQRLDRGVAALPGQAILAADHQHVFCDTGVDEVMRQHSHREARGAADLHGVGIGRTNTKMLGEHGGQHDMGRDRGITAENAVDVGALQPGTGDRKLGRLAHQVERGQALMLAEGCEADAGDEAHLVSTLSVVIPGRRKAASPESISPASHVARWIPGRRLTAHPGMTLWKFPTINTTSEGRAPSRR